MRNAGFTPVLFSLLFNSVETGLADGKVFARPDVQARVEIPNQQALIYHGGGIECLVIETSFLGEGTNFAWVVPLPGEPKVQPVSEGFFPSLRQAFQSPLLHYVHHYDIGILFVCGLAFLGWQSLKDEVAWVVDLPICILMAAGVGFLGKGVLFGMLTLILTLGTRLLVRTTASFTFVVLVGMLAAVSMIAARNFEKFGLVQTMGSDGDPAEASRAEVTVLSIQRAGVFDATIIQSTNPRAILDWLGNNSFAAPKSIEPVVRDYVERGWVFVASKVRREGTAGAVTSLHPLAFTFAASAPVFPMKLTGVDNGDCTVDLYVFGQERATASHFHAARCDRVADNLPDEPSNRWKSWLRLQDAEMLNCIGNSTVGTKLSAKLTPRQMNSDVEIKWRRFSTKAAVVYSHAGASTVALNIGAPLAVLGWLLTGASRGGWGVDEKLVSRLRWRMILAVSIIGLATYWLLPKVEIVTN